MPDLTASIPHQMSRDEAKRRIQEQMGAIRKEHAALANLKETWTGDTMAFSLTAMGQSVSGHLEVDDHVVKVSVTLPWLLRMLTGTVKPQIEQGVRRLLTRQKG